MHVPVTPELESRVKTKVDSGLYNNASEVARKALRFMDTHEDWILEIELAHLRAQIHIGQPQLAQLARSNRASGGADRKLAPPF